VNWSVKANILKNHAVTTFWPEVMSWNSVGLHRVVGGRSKGKGQSGRNKVDPEPGQ
jgi:hypothetical protein